MIKGFAPSEALDDAELQGLATVAAECYDLLARARPELGHLTVSERRTVREALIVDAAVMMHGYAALMRDYNDDLAKVGTKKASFQWEKRLSRLSSANRYRFGSWRGDFFTKNNPLWLHIGIVKPGKEGRRLTVMNTGAARSECARVLRQFLSLEPVPTTIEFLSRR
jgi:hypothetical protein